MSNIKVEYAKYLKSEETTYQELFEGFDTLYGITYSSSIKLIDEISSKFEHTEVIFGYKEVLDNNLCSLLAAQKVILNQLLEDSLLNSLYEKIKDGRLAMFLSNDIKSHEKIFVLKNKEGRTRVIVGSANLSYSAFKGLQRENIIVFDDQEAFDLYYDRYQKFKEEASSLIEEKIFVKVQKEGVEKVQEDAKYIPVISDMLINNIDLVIEEAEDNDTADFILTPSIEEAKKEFKGLKFKKPTKSCPALVFEKKMLEPFLKKYREDKKKQYKESRAFPKLILSGNKLTFHDREISLNPSKEDVEKEVQAYIDFYTGLDKYSYDKSEHLKDAKENYHLFACWYLATIFMPRLRYISNRNHHEVINFPVTGLLNGASNAGKSTFLKMMSRIMSGADIIPIQSKEFTSTKVEAYRHCYQGIPVNFDDLTKYAYKNHAEKIIKDDFYGINEKDLTYAAVACATNEVEGVKKEISKRALVCRIDIQLNDEEVQKVTHETKMKIANIKGALYGEYIRRMIPLVEDMILKMEDPDEVDYNPDIFLLSSSVFKEIIEEFTGETYDFVKEYTLADAKNPSRKGKKSIETFMLLWKNEKDNFIINKKENTLTYKSSSNEFREQLYNIAAELPAVLCARTTESTICVDLDKAEELFEIKFKKGFFK